MIKSKEAPTKDQTKALEEIKKWFKKDESRVKFKTLGGFAGTGKTTLLTWLEDFLDLDPYEIMFTSFTGKATNVLRQKGLRSKTLHSFLYNAFKNTKKDRKEEFVFKLRTDFFNERLVVIDEASMLSKDLFNDLFKIKGDIKLLFVGDHAQLPPVSSDFNIMENPHIKLEKILRQAALNPIIRLSKDIREGKGIKNNKEINEEGFGYEEINQKALDEAVDRNFYNDVFLCSVNKDRVFYNKHIREHIFQKDKDESVLKKNDRVIILENCKKQMVFNGQLITVSGCREEKNGNIIVFGKECVEDEDIVVAKIHPHSFLCEKTYNRFEVGKKHKISFKDVGVSCDYGYCLTVHKSQGSQFDNVFLKMSNSDKYIWKDLYDRWLYTAVTRAAKNLYFLY